jgi:hypothetical protein
MVTADQEASMTTHERIRQIFLQPRAAYNIEEIATLLGYSHEEILAAISRGDLAIEGAGEIPRIEWEELALAAVERWPQEVTKMLWGRVRLRSSRNWCDSRIFGYECPATESSC